MHIVHSNYSLQLHTKAVIALQLPQHRHKELQLTPPFPTRFFNQKDSPESGWAATSDTSKAFHMQRQFANDKIKIFERHFKALQVSDLLRQSFSTSSGSKEPEQLSKRAQLKRAVKDYGSTVIVFHVAISLASLGGFYAAVTRYSTVTTQ